jgi:hypothetical protein
MSLLENSPQFPSSLSRMILGLFGHLQKPWVALTSPFVGWSRQSSSEKGRYRKSHPVWLKANLGASLVGRAVNH